MALSDAQKAELTRKGNRLFNDGKYFEAGKIFALVGYKTGLIRLGDLFYFEKEMPLVAYGFYRNAQHKPMLDKIGEGFVFALKCLLAPDAATQVESQPSYVSRVEEYSVRQSNSPDAGVVTSAPSKESIDDKVARAVGMLRRLSA